MIKAFIVRPFGSSRPVLKKGKNPGEYTTVSYDFDNVESKLIKPALEATGVDGGTTGEVFEAGDIHEDMFSALLMDDLVIADITIHNANVYYELGIRHALRDQKTILLKGEGFDEIPFDITGFRYVTYEKDAPAKVLPELIEAIKATLSDQRTDSPVFKTLPHLEAQDPERYRALPEDFVVEVKIAEGARSLHKLELLAWEAAHFSWKIPAFRLIGEALYQAKAYTSARRLWEGILERRPVDREANDRLATIYQRLAEDAMKTDTELGLTLLTRSDLAISNLLGNNTLSNDQRAEAYALRGRNAKNRWHSSWKDLPADLRQQAALRSGYLLQAYKIYEKALFEDLNHYYAGINAMGLLAIILHLAEKDPETWRLGYEDAAAADRVLEDLRTQFNRLLKVLRLSIDAARARTAAAGKPDLWAEITEADYICLTTSQPQRAVLSYERALANASNLNKEAVIRQLQIYAALDVMSDNVNAVIDSIKTMPEAPAVHTFLFTGHRIDEKDRPLPRFPSSKEGAAREQIREALLKEQQRLKEQQPPGPALQFAGIAGGANGGDILFHEVCKELGITTTMCLAVPVDDFKRASVNPAGAEWTDRFDALYKVTKRFELHDDDKLPLWLQKMPGKRYNVWMRNNIFELYRGLANGGMNMTLFALWDRKDGDGPGGTADMVKLARDRVAKVVVLEV
jgi:hypothetical protein